MESSSLPFYRLEFAKRAEWKHREDELRTFAVRAQIAKNNEEKRRHIAEDERDALMFAIAMELASPSRKELRLLLDKAYVLPDGRRVFKTEDGTRVFDEHGVEVKNINTDQIEDWRTTWERYKEPFERKQALDQERHDLLKFQKLTDEVRAETHKAQEDGGLTRERLEELKKKLSEEAPEAVKRNLPVPDLDQAKQPQSAEPAVARPAAKLDMPVL